MAYSYNSGHPTDLDLVRFLSGDIPVNAVALLHDEEIQAILDSESNDVQGRALPYYAAATCIDAIVARLALRAAAANGKGLVSKTVSRLSLSWGVDSTSVQALRDRASVLRREGAERSIPAGRSNVIRMF